MQDHRTAGGWQTGHSENANMLSVCVYVLRMSELRRASAVSVWNTLTHTVQIGV